MSAPQSAHGGDGDVMTGAMDDTYQASGCLGSSVINSNHPLTTCCCRPRCHYRKPLSYSKAISFTPSSRKH